MSLKNFSPNMLKTFEICPKKFFFKYVKKISMPINDEIFEFGKNIHALAAYYLQNQNITKMELALNNKEKIVWEYLKNSKYFGMETVKTEYNLSVKVGKYFFGGRLDALVKDPLGDYYILDYKTGSAPQNAKYDFQTIIYLLAVSTFYKTTNVHFVYLDLKNKTDIKIDFSENLKNEYEKKLKDITAKIETPINVSKKSDCNCEYRKICY